MHEAATRPDYAWRDAGMALAPAGGKSAGAGRPARILIVEDDYIVALELEHQLLEAGFDVVAIATTAEEAIRQAGSKNPDLAIMDIRLPGKRDGVEAAVELHASGIPSIFATAHADAQTRERAERARPLGWLQKPYAPASLIAAINAALAAKS
jgi:CheY-like chemotaxis protein